MPLAGKDANVKRCGGAAATTQARILPCTSSTIGHIGHIGQCPPKRRENATRKGSRSSSITDAGLSDPKRPNTCAAPRRTVNRGRNTRVGAMPLTGSTRSLREGA
eukprot:8268259-Pyramimonas_sp.AAC.2